MLFSQLIQKLIQDTTEKSLPLFSVELCLCVTIVLMLLVMGLTFVQFRYVERKVHYK